MNDQQQNRILRRPQVLAVTGLSNSALDRELRAERFPRPIKLSPDPKARAVGWPESSVQSWIAERIASAGAQRGAA